MTTVNAQPIHPAEEPLEKERPRFQFMRLADLRKRAPTKWLIRGIVAEGLLSVYYGPYGCGKSFGVLDMCLCLDTGRAWHGHKVQPVRGRVIYIAAEGVSGIQQRIEAWKIENHIEVDPDLLILGEAPQLTSSADTLALKDAIHQELGPDTQPALIVIDTLARSMVGHNEDKAEHMGIAIANVQVLQRTFGCHVMLVHHTGKANNGPRGSVALPAACETEILVTRDDDIITMKCIKQKDGDEFTDLKFTLKVVPLPTAEPVDEFATNTSSCVLVDYAPADSGANGQLAKADRDVLNVFASFTPGEQVRNADIKKASGYMGGTLTRSLDRLEKLGYICKSGTGVGTRYWLKTRGECQEIPENSGTDDGTVDECTEVDQLDRRDNQNGTHGTHPYGVYHGPYPGPFFIGFCEQCGAPAERATQGGDPLCDSHFEAYDPDEKCPKDVCERCGRKAWAHAIGGPDYGHVCITCLPNLINNKENQRRARKRDMKRAG